MYDLTQLRTLVAVVQEGHLTRASERLHISQPAASHHIRALEDHFCVTLFHRTSRGLEATSAGKQIAEWAKELIQASTLLNQRAQQLVGVASYRLAIGTITQPHLLSSIAKTMAIMRERHPTSELTVEAGTSWSIRQAIKADELDGGTIAGVVRGEDLACYPLCKLDYVLVAPASWKERVSRLNTEQIAALPWVVTGRDTPSQELIERLFKEEGLDINPVMTVSNATLLRAMVAEEVGIGFVQRHDAHDGVISGKFCILEKYHATLPLTFVHAKHGRTNAVLTEFASVLGTYWQSYRP